MSRKCSYLLYFLLSVFIFYYQLTDIYINISTVMQKKKKLHKKLKELKEFPEPYDDKLKQNDLVYCLLHTLKAMTCFYSR